MRVLITADTVGGVWTYTQELAEGLLVTGCDVGIVSVGPAPSDEQRSWMDGLRKKWLGKSWFAAKECSLEWMQDNAASYSAAESFLLERIRDVLPDILHSSQFCFGALPVDIPKIVVAHSDVFSWWRSCRGAPAEESEWLRTYSRLVHRGIEEADVVIAPTRWMLDQMEDCYGPLANAAVIPNGRRIAGPGRVSKKLQAITAGRLWDEAKNIGMLFEVESPFPVLVAGDESFERETVCTDTSQCVQMLGRLQQEALLRIFAESAVYICPSRYEPFGLTAVEAALSGCAIVANDIQSLREVWGDAAIYFTRDDAAALSGVLRSLADNRTWLELAAEKAHARAQERFSREGMARKYLGVYQQLLERKEDCHAA